MNQIISTPQKFVVQSRTFSSGKDVVYNCPHCGHDLISPLDEAGITDYCPNCKGTFNVPGEVARNREIEIAERRAEKLARSAQEKKKEISEETTKRSPDLSSITPNGGHTIVINNTAAITGADVKGESNAFWLLVWLFFGLPIATFLCITIIGIPFGLAMYIWFFIGLTRRI